MPSFILTLGGGFRSCRLFSLEECRQKIAEAANEVSETTKENDISKEHNWDDVDQVELWALTSVMD